LATQAADYSRSTWITFLQAKELGGSVRKGEKGIPCIFWRPFEGKDGGADREHEIPDSPSAAAARRRHLVLRYYTVFNVQQCDGLPGSLCGVSAAPAREIVDCREIASGYLDGPRVDHGFNRACYSPGRDRISMPAASVFESSEGYYATLFHELVHSTGHPDRLSRFPASGVIPPFGSPDYSREELVAEMGAALLCAEGGISCATIDNQAAYVAGWLETLAEDSRAVVVAAAQAQRAVDLILGRQPEQR
jgi:antirestriction protein ArdC